MGFFKNIFRRKSTEGGSPTNATALETGATTATAATPSNRRGRRVAKKSTKVTTTAHTTREDSPTQLIEDSPPPATFGDYAMGSNTSAVRLPSRGPDLSDGTQRAILSPRLNEMSYSESTQPVLVLPKVSSPVDLDDESYSNGTSYDEKKMDDNLATSESDPSRTSQPDTTPDEAVPSQAIFAMPDSAVVGHSKLRFSAGNVSVEDDTDGESSSFNLSTDAEDTEYEAMRRRLGAIMPPAPQAMDMSVTNYTTDGETSVFQGLPSEDDATMTTASVTKEASQQSILHLPTVNPATGASLVPVGPYNGTFPGGYDNRYKTPSDTTARFALPDDSRFVQQQQHAPSEAFKGVPPLTDEMRFALPDESRVSKTDEIRFHSKPQAENKAMFGTYSSPPVEDVGDGKIDLPRRSPALSSLAVQPKKDSPERKRSPKVSKQSLSTANANFPHYNSNFMEAIYGSPTEKPQPPPRRSFSKAQSAPQPTTGTAAATSTTFEPFASEPQPFDAAAPFASSNGQADEDLFAGFADFSNFENVFSSTPQPPPLDTRPTVSEKSVLRDHDDPLNRSNRSAQRNGVVTSTGAIHNETSLSELLAQAKSKSSRSGSHSKKTSTSVSSAPAMTASYLRQHHNLGKARTKNDGTSVTDIIHSLEAANASRVTESSSRSVGGSRHSRTHSRDDGQSAHSRDGASLPSAKEKHRRRRERRHHRSGAAGDHSSESEDDYEDNESWLFDEVTGTLGPRGIAADLESLSGRSNRSSSSRGNRSHKSHRSHKSGSRSSRRRTKAGSGDSVDSRHSRDSRRSRGSRYSHRSTRSYISQMSEQSRSVANDLLRLEMQLAMVGSGGPGTSAIAASDDRSLGGGRSRVARTAVATTSVTPSSSRRPATARRSRITVHAPPGKLGIILANKADSRGTVVSGVRTSSVLAETISPGDRIVAIDGEDVSLMTVSEITTIMARNADFDRTLTVLTTPRHSENSTAVLTNAVAASGSSAMGSPRSTADSYQPHRYSSYRN